MISISVQSDLNRLTRQLDDIARRQVPFATARALTATAKAAQKKLASEISSTFDRATPWIKNSAFATPATKAKLEAIVGIKDQGARATPAHYLRDHINTGHRGNKPMEKAMRAMGVLPAGWLAVPSKDGVQLDAYGNVSKTTLGRILRALAQKQTATRGAIASRLFVIRPGARSHLAPGIWSATRAGDQQVIKPVFLFVPEASYRKVLNLPRIVTDVVQHEFETQFSSALDQAIRTTK